MRLHSLSIAQRKTAKKAHKKLPGAIFNAA
jgi:hypothetical protein